MYLQLEENVQNYMKEAKWTNEGHIPTMEEHLEVSNLSIGYKLYLIAGFAFMGNSITDESFKWALNDPPLVNACCLLSRIMDDIVSHKVQQFRFSYLLYRDKKLEMYPALLRK